jgi:hemerythrin-like domain-containing protein
MQDLIDTHAVTAAAAAAPRLDLYAPIHQTLRAAMAQTLVALGALDITDADERAAVLARAKNLLALIESHLHHEEVFMHPALNAAEPGIVGHTEGEHAQHRTAIAMLRAEIDALAAAPQGAAAMGLYRRFALFVAENHEHMHVEETQLNAVLWAFYSDAELAQMHDRIVASIPPEEMAATLPLMLPALSPQQRAGMLGAMQAQMPAQAMQSVLAIAESALDRRSWAKLQMALAL